MSVLKNISSRKKPYHRPMFSLKSIDEVSELLCNETLDQESKWTTERGLVGNEAPILLVEGYGGELEFIAGNAGIPIGLLTPVSILKGGGPVEVQFADERNSALRQTFLLLDLRYRGHGVRGFLDSIGGIPDLGGTVPLVILVSSIEQFETWRGINASHCWQLRSRPSPAELAPALRSFLQLCAVFANRSNANKRAFSPTSK
jgi:hypothetical protein